MTKKMDAVVKQDVIDLKKTSKTTEIAVKVKKYSERLQIDGRTDLKT